MNTLKKLFREVPAILIYSMGAGFLTITLFIFHYYNSILLPSYFDNRAIIFIVALLASISVQSTRFAFALSGAFDFANGRKKQGFWGFLISSLITVYEIIECYQISKEKDGIFLFALAMVVIPFISEIRICILLGKNEEKEMIEEKELIEATPKERILIAFERLSEQLKRKPKLREIREYLNNEISLTTISKHLSNGSQ